MKTKTRSLYVAITCVMAATIINTAILTPPATWKLYTLAAYAQTTITQNNTDGTISTGENIQHWEKYDFIITSPELAAKLGVSPNTELNVKILSNSSSVEDMRQAILDSFKTNNTTEADKSLINLLGAFYNVVYGCPIPSAQYWERIDFMVTSPELAAKLGVSPNTELNVKLMTDPNSVEDMRQAVLDFFNANTTEADKPSIQILGTLNDVICAQ
jgi:galactitol-specific phosphotransferase system IIB component